MPTVLPFYHIFGLAVMNGTNLFGGKMIVLPDFSQELYVTVLKNNMSTLLYVVPPLVLLLTYHPEVKPEHLRNLRVIISGGAPLAATDEKELMTKIGTEVHFLQGYGLTETSPVVTTMYPSIMKNQDKDSYRGSIGKLVPNTLIKIVDPKDSNNIPLGVNSIGEILVRGPQVMKGYHKLLEETKEVLTEDGWLRTGDLGYYNEDKFLFINDRLKELIKVKGNQVAPAELESVIRSFPGVKDAAVIGIPHERLGEVPKAYIVTQEQVDVNELHDFVNEKVAKYKQIRGGIEIVEEIPKNAAGKILRKELKATFALKKK